jgi:lysine-N-methylase
MKITKLNKSTYLKNFSCSGDNCELTCCFGWNIAINKKSYKFLKRQLSKIDSDCTKILSKTYSKHLELYGNMDLKNIFCPLLDSSNLCTIHKNYGEKFLSLTCFNFPKVTNYIDSVIEVSAKTACPLVAELVLLTSSPIEFELTNYKKTLFNKTPLEISNKTSSHFSKVPFLYYDRLRMKLFTILNLTNVSLEKKLIFLVNYMEKLLPVIFNFNLEDIETHYSNLFQTTDTTTNKLTTHVDLSFQYDFILGNFIEEHMAILKARNAFPIFDNFTNSFKNSYKLDYNNYAVALIKYKDFSKEHSYLFTNFIQNWLINEFFPFKSKNSYYEIIRVIVNFIVIRHLIASNLFLSPNLNSKEKLDLAFNMILYYSRIFGNTQLTNLKNSDNTTIKNIFELLYVLINIE